MESPYYWIDVLRMQNRAAQEGLRFPVRITLESQNLTYHADNASDDPVPIDTEFLEQDYNAVLRYPVLFIVAEWDERNDFFTPNTGRQLRWEISGTPGEVYCAPYHRPFSAEELFEMLDAEALGFSRRSRPPSFAALAFACRGETDLVSQRHPERLNKVREMMERGWIPTGVVIWSEEESYGAPLVSYSRIRPEAEEELNDLAYRMAFEQEPPA
jgi:hypothetical protein